MLATFRPAAAPSRRWRARSARELICVDAGVNASTTHLDVVHTGLKPSANLAVEPALSKDDVRHAIKVGAAPRRRPRPTASRSSRAARWASATRRPPPRSPAG